MFKFLILFSFLFSQLSAKGTEMTVPEILYKVTTESLWAESQGENTLRLAQSDLEFIHLSEANQLSRILGKFFKGHKSVVLLSIDPQRLPGKLVHEANPGGSNLYYHLYEGAIPKNAIIEAKISPLVFIGTKNQIKVTALEEALRQYPSLQNVIVIPRVVSSGVSEQPLSLEELVKGAKTRAKSSYEGCLYGVGIESGIMHVTGTERDYMDICMCAIYDGHYHHLGMSCGFVLPASVVTLILDEGLDLNQAMQKNQFTTKTALGHAEGAIGVLTNGRITRKDYTKQSIVTAMCSIDNSQYYESSE